MDSAASDHYVPKMYHGDKEDNRDCGVAVGTANGGTMYSVASDVLKIAQLPVQARTCHKFAEVRLPLISVGKICQHGHTVVFTRDAVEVIRDTDGRVVLKGTRDPVRNLYMIPIDGSGEKSRCGTHKVPKTSILRPQQIKRPIPRKGPPPPPLSRKKH